MAKRESLTYAILREHLVSGELEPGKKIAIRIDQTLTQDATGTMAFLQFEAMGVPRVRTKTSVSYVDHNMLQAGFENADDHRVPVRGDRVSRATGLEAVQRLLCTCIQGIILHATRSHGWVTLATFRRRCQRCPGATAPEILDLPLGSRG